MTLPKFAAQFLDSFLPFVKLDEKCYILCLIFSYILSIIYFQLFVKNPKRREDKSLLWIKHVYNAFFGHLYYLICFTPYAFVHFYTPILFTYFFVQIMGKNGKGYGRKLSFSSNKARTSEWIKAEMVPWIVFIVTMIHLSIHQLIRQIKYPHIYVLNYTGPMMMLLIRLHRYSCEHSMGEEETSFLEFLGYCFHYPCLLCGPSIRLSEYRNFVNGSMFRSLSVSQKGRKRHAMWCFLFAVFVAIAKVYVSQNWDLMYVKEPAFAQEPFWYKLFYSFMNLADLRFKYTFGWIIVEGALTLQGLGYLKDSQGIIHWNNCKNINVKVVELAVNPRESIGAWNITTNRWLRDCIYNPLTEYLHGEGAKGGLVASILTYMISAMWHGYYPGYYLTFISLALLNYFARVIYKRFTWPGSELSRRIVLYIPNFMLFSYFAMPFPLMNGSWGLQYFKNMHYFGHIFLILASIILVLFVPVQTSKQQMCLVPPTTSTNQTSTTSGSLKPTTRSRSNLPPLNRFSNLIDISKTATKKAFSRHTEALFMGQRYGFIDDNKKRKHNNPLLINRNETLDSYYDDRGVRVSPRRRNSTPSQF